MCIFILFKKREVIFDCRWQDCSLINCSWVIFHTFTGVTNGVPDLSSSNAKLEKRHIKLDYETCFSCYRVRLLHGL